jgi:hypothetical protein
LGLIYSLYSSIPIANREWKDPLPPLPQRKIEASKGAMQEVQF